MLERLLQKSFCSTYWFDGEDEQEHRSTGCAKRFGRCGRTIPIISPEEAERFERKQEISRRMRGPGLRKSQTLRIQRASKQWLETVQRLRGLVFIKHQLVRNSLLRERAISYREQGRGSRGGGLILQSMGRPYFYYGLLTYLVSQYPYTPYGEAWTTGAPWTCRPPQLRELWTTVLRHRLTGSAACSFVMTLGQTLLELLSDSLRLGRDSPRGWRRLLEGVCP
eukprot:Polyplicarium_translucidae@DN1847_c0_g1_i1.p1